jgi:hypothetical protein
LKINLKKQRNCITKQVLDAPRPKKKKNTNNNQKLEDSFDRAVFTVSTGRRGNLKRALLKKKNPTDKIINKTPHETLKSNTNPKNDHNTNKSPINHFSLKSNLTRLSP